MLRGFEKVSGFGAACMQLAAMLSLWDQSMAWYDSLTICLVCVAFVQCSSMLKASGAVLAGSIATCALFWIALAMLIATGSCQIAVLVKACVCIHMFSG
jgi:hypothetical protein